MKAEAARLQAEEEARITAEEQAKDIAIDTTSETEQINIEEEARGKAAEEAVNLWKKRREGRLKQHDTLLIFFYFLLFRNYS